MLKDIFAVVGFITVLLWASANFGLGSFVYMYGPNKINCTKAGP